jgi:hypothetical protein
MNNLINTGLLQNQCRYRLNHDKLINTELLQKSAEQANEYGTLAETSRTSLYIRIRISCTTQQNQLMKKERLQKSAEQANEYEDPAEIS